MQQHKLKVKVEDYFHRGPCGRAENNVIYYIIRELRHLKNKIDHMARGGWRVSKARPSVLWAVIRSLDFILKAKESHWEFSAR